MHDNSLCCEIILCLCRQLRKFSSGMFESYLVGVYVVTHVSCLRSDSKDSVQLINWILRLWFVHVCMYKYWLLSLLFLPSLPFLSAFLSSLSYLHPPHPSSLSSVPPSLFPSPSYFPFLPPSSLTHPPASLHQLRWAKGEENPFLFSLCGR